ncbi:hypothetical protein [Streptomyces sp. NBC_01589]|uniref:hypothetical protein n=1 Tax=unclassified Streptomyces TaxID=2593676 RepID=UPI00386DAAC7
MPGTREAKRRTRTTTPLRDGREPTGFAAVLQGLMADGAWDLPTGGGRVPDLWPGMPPLSVQSTGHPK